MLLQVIYAIAVLVFTSSMFMGLSLKLQADRSGKVEEIKKSFGQMARTDRLIAAPAMAVTLAANLFVNDTRVLPLCHLNLSWAILILFAYSMVVFIAVVKPLRDKLAAMAADSLMFGSFDTRKYISLSNKWVIWGIIELAPLVTVLIYSVIDALPVFRHNI